MFNKPIRTKNNNKETDQIARKEWNEKKEPEKKGPENRGLEK